MEVIVDLLWKDVESVDHVVEEFSGIEVVE